jgi:undecaprenyl-diphosphatase
MEIIHAVILGVVEGATEFLPISSTFHLLMASRLLGIEQTEFAKFFDVFIQAGAILAVVVLFAREWFGSIDFLKKIAVSFIPTAIVGFLLHEVITGVFFESFRFMITVFMVVGVAFIFLERHFAKRTVHQEKTIEEMSWKEAVIIGLAQAAAVFPGVSRAGAVIIAMLLLRYRRDEAAKYSFTLAVPTILSAAALDTIKMRELIMTTGGQELMILLIGSVTAFLSALVVIKWFIHFLRQRTFVSFGWYRIVAGAVLFFLVK